jgi:hypothetical protein
MRARALPGAFAIALGAGCAGLLGVDGIVFEDAGSGGSGAGGASHSSAGAGAGGASHASSGGSGPGGSGPGGSGPGGSGPGGSGAAAGTGAGGSGGGGGTSSSSTGVPACVSAIPSEATEQLTGCDAATVEAASDEFEEGLSGWCTLQRDQDPESSITEDGHAVTIRTSCSQWNEISFGPALFRVLSASFADFAVATRVTISNGAGGTPVKEFHGGGLIVRKALSPPGTTEDYLLWTSGQRGSNNFGGTVYSTTQGDSTVVSYAFSVPTAQRLGLCRIGGEFQFFTHNGSNAWQEVVYQAPGAPVTHPELEGEVQVGLAGHAYNGTELLLAKFDFIRFGVPASDCQSALEDLAP